MKINKNKDTPCPVNEALSIIGGKMEVKIIFQIGMKKEGLENEKD